MSTADSSASTIVGERSENRDIVQARLFALIIGVDEVLNFVNRLPNIILIIPPVPL